MNHKIYVLFAFLILASASFAGVDQNIPCIWDNVERIVAVGDLHGDFENTVIVLKAAQLLNENLQWTGNNTHLVQTGDILDRGPDSKKILDLMFRLKKEAVRKGGYVHLLIGNHEAMVMTGDHRYVNPNDFKSFGGKKAFHTAFSPQGDYGAKLAQHNAVIKINDTLFLHGGISEKYVNTPLEQINNAVRAELTCKTPQSMIDDSHGPLWDRSLAGKDTATLKQQVSHILENFKVNRIVVGHTVSKNGIQSRMDGKIIMIDTGISKLYGGPQESLLIENNTLFRVSHRGKTPLHTKKESVSEKK